MIRLATIEDVEAINIIRKEVNDMHVEAEPALFKSGWPKELQDSVISYIESDNCNVLVCENNDIIYGYVMIKVVEKPESIHCKALRFLKAEELGVKSGLRGRGYGRELIEGLKTYAKGKGFDRVELDMWAFNEGAEKFYEKLGFETYRKFMRLILD